MRKMLKNEKYNFFKSFRYNDRTRIHNIITSNKQNQFFSGGEGGLENGFNKKGVV